MIDGDIRDALIQLAQAVTTQAQAMTAQAYRDCTPSKLVNVTMASRLRDFSWTNPPTVYWSKVEEDHQEFIDKVYNILLSMGLSTSEKAELDTYQLKDISQVWYGKWRNNRPLGGCAVTWEIFKKDFLDRFFPREMRETKVVEFINLHQGGMSVHEYSLKFTK